MIHVRRAVKEPGWLYVIDNPAMPGMVKIGRTARQPEERAAELDRSGAPMPYRVSGKWWMNDMRAAERAAHDAFARYRVRSSREWFAIRPRRAVRRMERLLRLHRRYGPFAGPVAAVSRAAAMLGWVTAMAVIALFVV